LKDIDDALRETGLLAENLEIEITENIALEYERAEEILHSLHERGVKLASDDFGTGYASLSYLTKFPFSRIKIDCSFMKDITENVENAAIVRSLISMARNLGLKVIAEGIETREQATFLLNERCEEAQGFLYSKPLSAAEFETFLRMRRLESQEPTANVKPLFQVAKVQGAAGESRRRRRTPKA
jgi:EAL domain-containing protein (putative c-di-GMP-specific phosphodiesterase class I)